MASSRTTSGRTPDLRGLTVAHTKNNIDHYGARRRRDGEIRHMNNTEATEPGWLGNPYLLPDDAGEDGRREVIGEFAEDFVERVETDDEFREAVEDLRGKAVGCWCRGITKDRSAGPWCHLDVVDCWLRGDLDPVRDYTGRTLNP